MDATTLHATLVANACDDAAQRGTAFALSDAPYFRESPLSGEWVGESVNEMLGDLIELVGDQYAQDICDAFEDGYHGTAIAFAEGRPLNS